MTFGWTRSNRGHHAGLPPLSGAAKRPLTNASGAYHVTKAFPKDERFGLTAQMRRAASSIPMNIAEGFGRRSEKDRARFVDIALGSTNEFQYQLILSKDLSYLEQDQHDTMNRLLIEVRKMLSSLLSTLRSSSQ